MDGPTSAPQAEATTPTETLRADPRHALAGEGKRPRGRPRGGGSHLLVTVSLTRWTLDLLDAMSMADSPPKRPGKKKQGRSATLRRLVVKEAELRGLVR
jgi:hypothetical protein